MYAYVTLIIVWPDVKALPLELDRYSGEQTFCWLYEDGKAVRTEIETGMNDDHWIEVTNHRPPVSPEAAATRRRGRRSTVQNRSFSPIVENIQRRRFLDTSRSRRPRNQPR